MTREEQLRGLMADGMTRQEAEEHLDEWTEESEERAAKEMARFYSDNQGKLRAELRRLLPVWWMRYGEED